LRSPQAALGTHFVLGDFEHFGDLVCAHVQGLAALLFNILCDLLQRAERTSSFAPKDVADVRWQVLTNGLGLVL
jgi:hypothetical protein